MDRNSGQITVAEKLDFETKGTYFVTMIATDRGRLKDEIDITIEVRNLDEPGVITLSPVQSETIQDDHGQSDRPGRQRSGGNLAVADLIRRSCLDRHRKSSVTQLHAGVRR